MTESGTMAESSTMALSLLLVNLLLFHSAFTQISKNQALISGSGEVHLVPEDGGGNDSCTVPAYSRPLFEVNATEENVRLLLTEGRCYLSCLNRYPTMIMNVSLYPIWPFAVLNEDATCTSTITQLHECTRGCRTLLMNSTVTRRNLGQNRKTILGSCLETCMAECRAECGGQDRCENPDSIDLWVTRTGCTITCTSRLPCTLGCLNGEDIILEETPFDPVPPLPPVSTPTLVELKNSSISSEQGLYSVNLTNAVGDRDRGVGLWIAFLFQIHDLTSNNITYIWQHDPRIYLNLSSHICREVDVSFSVVNQFGSTSFSEPVRLTLRGDTRQLPNAPFIRRIEDTLDLRNGFFQHVITNVTWESPQDYSHLMHFEVSMRSDLSHGYCQATNVKLISKFIEHTSEKEYSTLLKAETARDDPIMGCNYTIKLTSVGEDGNRSVSKLYTTKSLEDYMAELMIFSCNKQLAISGDGNPYFKFYYNLMMVASNLAEGNYITEFRVSRDIVNVVDDRGQTQDAIIPEAINPGPELYPFMPNMTQYVFDDVGYTRFHQPRLNPSYYFLFKLSIIWNMDQLLITPTLDSYSCRTSALSPRPTDVRNFTVLNATVVSTDTASINATWLPPLQSNGILSNYQICMSRIPLTGLVQPENENLCEKVNSTRTSISTRLRFFKFSEDNFIYVQIRPNNTFEEGNWSDFYTISLKMESTTAAVFESSTALADISTAKSGISLVGSMATNFAPRTGLSDGEIAVTTVIVVILVMSLCVLFLVCYVRILRRRKRLMKLTETAPNYMPMFSVSYSPNENPAVLEVDSIDNSLSDEWELSPSDVTVDKLLGEGAFGEVYSGYLKGPLANNKVKPEFRNVLHLPVAIKLLKDTARGSERQDFLSEIEMMKKVSEGNNSHVVAMLGCVTTQEPLCLVTEFVEFGDLLSYIRSSRNLYLSGSTNKQEDPYVQLGQLTPADIPSFSYQIAAGMAYLSSIGIVHRDLACRNVLVSADKALRITDFGMSRETEDIYVQESKGRVPYKWMAIESIIAREFTSASDVWAFGVVLWEIETLGGVPYPGVSNAELLPLLKRGHRMEKPDSCSSEIYNIMISCWQEDSRQRPSFHVLKSKFNDILASHGSNAYVDFCIDPNKLYYKTDEECDIPSSMHLLHPSPRVDRKSKNISPAGSFEAVSLRRTSSSPQDSPRMKRQSSKVVTHSPSAERFFSGQIPSMNHGEDRRPSSMMLLKHSYKDEKRRKSGLDQDKDKEGDDRYVKDPSALLGVPNALLGGEASHDGHRKTAGSDGKLNLNSKASPMVE